MTLLTESMLSYLKGTGRHFDAVIKVGNKEITDSINEITLVSPLMSDKMSFGLALSSYVDVSLFNCPENIAGCEIELLLKFNAPNMSETGEISLGFFTVEKPKTSDYLTTFTAYDKVKSIKGTYTSTLSGEQPIDDIFADISSQCGVECEPLYPPDVADENKLKLDSSTLDGKEKLYLLQQIAAYFGGNLICNRNGKFEVRTLSLCTNEYDGDVTDVPEIGEFSFTLKRLTCTTQSETLTVGEGEGIDFSCFFMTQERLNELFEDLNNFSYTAVSCDILVGDPFLEVGNIVTLKYGKKSYTVPVMKLELNFDGGVTTKIESYVQTEFQAQTSRSESISDHLSQTKTYAQAAHTAHQTFLKTLKDGLDKGLYQTVKKSADGSSVTYYHDTPQLENATYIQVFTSTGRAWTQGSGCWNGGDPNWQYGENKDGDAILRDLLIRTLTADLIRTGKLSSFDGKTYFDLDNANFHTENEYTESGTTYLDIADIANGIATFSKVEKDTDDTSNSPTTMVGKAGILSLGPSPKLNSEITKRYLPDNYESLSLLEKMLAYSTALVKAIFYNMYGFNAITSDTESGNLLYMHSDGNGISFIQLNSEDDENTSSTAYYGKDGAEAPDFTISKFDGTNDLSVKDALDAIEKYVTPRDFRNEVTFESGEEGTYNSIFMRTGNRVDINYQGTAKAHSSNDLLFTLPSSLFPPHQVHVSMVKNAGAYGTVVIGTDGKARVNFISNTNTQTRIYFQATYYIN